MQEISLKNRKKKKIQNVVCSSCDLYFRNKDLNKYTVIILCVGTDRHEQIV